MAPWTESRGTATIMPTKSHLIFDANLFKDISCFQYEPVITPGNENMIHHLILYRCKGINTSMDGVQGNCYARDRPLPSCFNMVVAWVVGGKVWSRSFVKLTHSPDLYRKAFKFIHIELCDHNTVVSNLILSKTKYSSCKA